MNNKKIIIGIIIIVLIAITVLFLNNKSVFEDSNKTYERIFFVQYSQEGDAGIIDNRGKQIIKNVYQDIYIPNPEKDVFICKIDDDNYEIIDSNGEKLFGNYNNVSVLSIKEDAYEFEKEVLRFEENGKYGLINLDGEIVAKSEYDSIESLKAKPGKILVKKDGYYGVIDIKGNIVIEPEYMEIIGDNFSTEEDGYTKTGYIVKKHTTTGDFYGYISNKGKVFLKPEYEYIERISNFKDSDNVYLIQMKDGKKGVYKNKKKIIDNLYQTITYAASSNIIVAKTTKNNIFYNLDGRNILNKKFEDYTLAGKYILVNEDNNKKLYDTNGNFISNFSYKTIEATSNPNYFITVDNDNHYSIMNKTTIIKDNYINLRYAYGDYFIFTTEENKVGVLNVWTGVVIEPTYDNIQKIYNVNALEARSDNITDIYSKDLEKVSTISDAIVENVKDKYAVIYSDTEMVYIDENGKEVSNTKIFNNNLYAVNQDGKWGFKDKLGNIKIDCEYDIVTELNQYGFAGIKKDGMWGVIDKDAHIILEPNYEIETYYFPSFLGKSYIIENETVSCIKLDD